MKYFVFFALFALCAGAFAQQEAEEVDVDSLEPEVELCPQILIDLYRASRNECIDEIRANRTVSESQGTDGTTTEDPTSHTDGIEDIEDDDHEEDDVADDTENVEDNRSRRSSGSRRHRARGRAVRWSRRRKQFFRQFRSCLVNKIRGNPIVTELHTACVANCTSVIAAKREHKEQKCVLKNLKQRCPDIVPPRRPRIHRRNRINNNSHH